MSTSRKNALRKTQTKSSTKSGKLVDSFQKSSGQVGRVGIHAYIDEKVYNKFKILALKKNVPMRDLLEDLMREAIKPEAGK